MCEQLSAASCTWGRGRMRQCRQHLNVQRAGATTGGQSSQCQELECERVTRTPRDQGPRMIVRVLSRPLQACTVASYLLYMLERLVCPTRTAEQVQSVPAAGEADTAAAAAAAAASAATASLDAELAALRLRVLELEQEAGGEREAAAELQATLDALQALGVGGNSLIHAHTHTHTHTCTYTCACTASYGPFGLARNPAHQAGSLWGVCKRVGRAVRATKQAAS